MTLADGTVVGEFNVVPDFLAENTALSTAVVLTVDIIEAKATSIGRIPQLTAPQAVLYYAAAQPGASISVDMTRVSQEMTQLLQGRTILRFGSVEVDRWTLS